MPYTEVMHKFKEGKLKSGGDGTTVKSRPQAIAIMLSEKRESADKPEYRAKGLDGIRSKS